MSDTARRFVLGIFLLGLAGVTVELWLLDHDEDARQLVPLVLAAAAMASAAVMHLRAGAAPVRLFQGVMGLLILSGFAGTVLHLQANMEFQRDIDPSLGGFALVQKALRAKAPPALAPGAMIQLGLLGIAVTFRHPRLSRSNT